MNRRSRTVSNIAVAARSWPAAARGHLAAVRPELVQNAELDAPPRLPRPATRAR